MGETELNTIPRIRQVYYDTYANLPTTGLKVGDLAYATDHQVLYYWDGTTWQPITVYGVDLNKVKLPSPSGSDYVTPSAISVSSTSILDNLENGWAYAELDTNGLFSDGGNETTIKTEGTASRKLIKAGNSPPIGDYTQISKAIDLTGVGSLYFDFRQSLMPAAGKHSLKVLIGAVEEYSQDLNGKTANNWHKITVDVSAYSGVQTVALRIYMDAVYSVGTFNYYFDNMVHILAASLIDDNLATQWRPEPVNEVNAWLRADMGALKITSGCRIYWGADADYRPTAYRIEVSENGTDWTTVITETSAAPASAWKEYSWNSRYARYIRMIVDTHGATGTEVFEVDYYSRITDRVAAEHGHGSGVTKHLKVKHSEHHPEMRKGETLRSKVKNLDDLLKYLDFMLDN